MSPARLARRKAKRLAFIGIFVETAFVAGLAASCCLACALLFLIMGR